MNRSRYITQRIAKALIWTAALSTILVMFLILFQILKDGLPVLSLEFFRESPKNMGRDGGILSTIVGTFALTMVAIFVATPLGVGTAVFLREYTRESAISRVIRFGTDCLAGVPSIIFGLFGFVFFVIFLNMGWSILSGGLTLAVMILPTIISTAEEAIKTIPYSYREVSYSLGATRWQMVVNVIIPNALPGIFTGVILGVGRSIGETAAVILTAGSSLIMPTSIFSPIRTMAVHFYILAREGISMEMAYGTGAALILLVLLINTIANWSLNRYVRNKA
ncbi:MAG TPA: phosphate ABC transporter permease PstA [Thermodesulfobacteriota bacterium]|nr:phosphate ABC transporter permease PstA [Deltaproteobacteria bacterium]HNR14775.1 phosphate ABC transporter permease PstA [Thermodesulfobacteriota bacterium]HNU71768.1 phosphate ABC transporter permease PstA [Thermodesulfobacteriota bacterium]